MAACADRDVTPGDKSYSTDGTYCIESYTDTISYKLSDTNAACAPISFAITKSSEHPEDEVPDNACCKAAVDDITIAATASTLSELNPWCEERDEI